MMLAFKTNRSTNVPMYQCRPGLPKTRSQVAAVQNKANSDRHSSESSESRLQGQIRVTEDSLLTLSSIWPSVGSSLSNPCRMEEDKRRRSIAGADSKTAPRFSLLWGHISCRPSPSFPQVRTPENSRPDQVRQARGKVPNLKLINKDLLSDSRERGPLPVGPHPRLFLYSGAAGPGPSESNVRHSTAT
jgi:hypothetical protein